MMRRTLRAARAPLSFFPICRDNPVFPRPHGWRRREAFALAIGITVAEARAMRVRKPRAASLFGAGQMEEIAEMLRLHDAELLIVDGSLTAIQQRNLEKAVEAKVIDRTGLILEIFGETGRDC